MNTLPSSKTSADVATESVAGEEDPGASIDVAMAINANRAATAQAAATSGQPSAPESREPSAAQAPMSPGDDAPPGTRGTGENVCPRCGGTGKLAGSDCTECQGTGKVNVGIGGA